MNPALNYLRQVDEAVAFRALARCLHACADKLGAEDSLVSHRRQGQAYTLENRARGIEIRLGLPEG